MQESLWGWLKLLEVITADLYARLPLRLARPASQLEAGGGASGQGFQLIYADNKNTVPEHRFLLCPTGNFNLKAAIILLPIG